MPSNNTSASDGGGTGSAPIPGSTIFGTGRSRECCGHSPIVACADAIANDATYSDITSGITSDFNSDFSFNTTSTTNNWHYIG